MSVPPVFVDALQTSTGGAKAGHTFCAGKQFCHLMAADFSTEAIDALHVLAAAIGLRRVWFQDESSWPHYDLTPSKRALAIASGAIVEDRRTGAYRRRAVREALNLEPHS